MNHDKVGARLWNEIAAALRELPKERFRTKLRSFLSGLLHVLRKDSSFN